MLRFSKQLLTALVIGIITFNTAAFAFVDVHHTSPDYYAVEYLRRNKVVPDVDHFLPEAIVSKAEFVQYLVKLNAPDFNGERAASLPFEDTGNDEWYAPYLAEAIDLGIVDDDDSKFYPYKKITVIEALELLFHSKSIPIPRKHVGDIQFKDVDNNKRSQGLVMRSIGLGIIEPVRMDYFGLYKKVSRQLAARMIYRMDLVDLRAPQFTSDAGNYASPGLSKIADVWELITSNFVGAEPPDHDAMTAAAIKAMVGELGDPYSNYLEPEENQSFNDDLDGEIEGIGAFISEEENGEIVIVSPIADSPAEAAGLKPGDVIVKVDDFSVEGASLYEIVRRIKGPKGTKVTLTVRREGRTLSFQITRDVVTIEAVRYRVIGAGNIMHIEVLTFNENLIPEFKEAVEIIQADTRIEGLVIDLRNNPGGLLSAALGMLNYLLPNRKPTVKIEYNFFNYDQYTTSSGPLAGMPMVVLINKGSASASEIVAGALKDHEAATLVGETSFGKGTVQEINLFGDNSSLKLTIARWFTPNGHSIQGNGIEPDVTVINQSDHIDAQLDRAISELNKKIR